MLSLKFRKLHPKSLSGGQGTPCVYRGHLVQRSIRQQKKPPNAKRSGTLIGSCVYMLHVVPQAYYVKFTNSSRGFPQPASPLNNRNKRTL